MPGIGYIHPRSAQSGKRPGSGLAGPAGRGADAGAIAFTLKAFKGVAHRIEFVRELDGVKYYNDSKGTNPAAAIPAVRAMDGATVLIAGGYDKHADFSEWVDTFPGKVTTLDPDRRDGGQDRGKPSAAGLPVSL